MPSLRMGGVILLFHIHAFMAWTGTILLIYIYLVDKYEWLASCPGHFASKKKAAGML
jgi:hypothetical protein